MVELTGGVNENSYNEARNQGRDFSEEELEELRSLQDLEEKSKMKTEALQELLTIAKSDLMIQLDCMPSLYYCEDDYESIAESYSVLHKALLVVKALDNRVNCLFAKLTKEYSNMLCVQNREIFLLNQKNLSSELILEDIEKDKSML